MGRDGTENSKHTGYNSAVSISVANINSVWGSLLVEELIRCGADYFCISPGSRSAPLAMAVANNARANTFVHFDERGAAYRALGYARATGKSAVLICTSGTAVANYLPAVVEASSDMLPLILLTADRPPELHNVGANQTIEQANLFGDFVRWSFNLPCPDRAIPPEMPLTTIDYAVQQATRVPAGPVHVNCMFREPLAPVDTGEDFRSYLSSITGWLDSSEPYTKYEQAERVVDTPALDRISKILDRAKAGIVILGHLPRASDRNAALALAERMQWPVFADITSGARLGAARTEVIPFFNLALTSDHVKQTLRPDTIFHIGGRVVSKRLMQWIEESSLKSYIHVVDHPTRIDPIHCVTHRVETDIESFCRTLSGRIGETARSDYMSLWLRTSGVIDHVLQQLLAETGELVEAGVARLLSTEISPDTALFLASSMPIRDMDIFAAADGPRVPVAANRGASGIDGTVASAAGYAVGIGQPVTLLIGDLALLHDLNSLAMLHNSETRVIVVVINNNGGGIFDHLPISEFGESYEKFFVNPHGFRFEFVAKQFGLDYTHAQTIAELRSQYRQAIIQERSAVIEVAVDRAENMRFHKRLIHEIGSALKL